MKSVEEYYYCFGFHHAKDRAWQMEHFRRAALGRNAELYGVSAIKNDLMMRILDLESLAKRIYSELPESKKENLVFYAKGANEGFKTGKLSQEFIDLNYEPEKWKPYHSILVLLLQSFDQTRKTFFSEFEETKYAKTWKEKTPEIFKESSVPWFSTILKENEYPKINKVSSVQSSSYNFSLWHNFPEIFGKESGSNNWVVDKTKSKSGHAIFANDPHLELRTPLFWYFIHLKSPELEVFGGSLPGVPVIASGTNMNVAWGLTNSYINTANLYELDENESFELKKIRPVVYFKFWLFKVPFFFKSFLKTESNLPLLPLDDDKKIVLKWSGYSLKGDDVSSIFDLPSAKDSSSFKTILEKIKLSSWNYVFADTKGNVGLQVVGNAFRAEKDSKWGIEKLSYDELEKDNYLTSEELPNLYNPKRGYIYSANNRHWPDDSALNGGRGYSSSFRGFRIDELIKSSKHDVESFKNIQCDVQAVDARFLIPVLKNKINMPELDAWDFYVRGSEIQPTIFRTFMNEILEKWNVNEDAFFYLITHELDQRAEELQKIYDEVVKKYKTIKWESIHRINFKHLSNQGFKFSPELSGVGDKNTVNPGTMKWNEDLRQFDHTSGASMRMIIEMKERPEIYLVLPGKNRNYARPVDEISNWENWRTCKYTRIQ